MMDEADEFCDAAPQYLGWQADMLQPHVEGDVLEIGACNGNLTAQYVEDVAHYTALDIAPRYVSMLESTFGHLEHFEAVRADISDRASLERLPCAPYDTVLSSNVFEHIEDDEAAFRHAFRALVPGGHLGLLVPAMSALYSEWDRKIGHHRRYEREQLKERGEAAGFDTVECRYVNMAGVLGWWVNFTLLDRELSSEEDNDTLVWQAKLYDQVVVPLCRRLEAWLEPPLGLSLLYVGRRPET
jgi:SAM-dependent methyltransferase